MLAFFHMLTLFSCYILSLAMFISSCGFKYHLMQMIFKFILRIFMSRCLLEISTLISHSSFKQLVENETFFAKLSSHPQSFPFQLIASVSIYSFSSQKPMNSMIPCSEILTCFLLALPLPETVAIHANCSVNMYLESTSDFY